MIFDDVPMYSGLHNTCPIPLTTWVVPYMLNDVPHNLRVHTNGYYICVCPLCVLENGGVSECYTDILSVISSLKFNVG